MRRSQVRFLSAPPASNHLLVSPELAALALAELLLFMLGPGVAHEAARQVCDEHERNKPPNNQKRHTEAAE